jgi:phosphoglycolate phosphatase-like HAD superfamily hydrolase
MIKLIIFDWDDVFTIGSKEGYLACYYETMRLLGIDFNTEDIDRMVLSRWGRPHHDAFEVVFQDTPEIIEKACILYEELLFGTIFTDRINLVPGGRELLLELKENYTLCVATGMSHILFKEKIVPEFRIPDVFFKVLSGYEIADPKLRKPDPYMVRHLLELTGFEAAESLVVGDAEPDMKMAIAAGAIPAAVLTGHMVRKDAESLGIKHILDDVTGVKELLVQLDAPASAR